MRREGFIVVSRLVWQSPLRREVAQVVAHLVWDQRVAGSSPVFPTYKCSELIARSIFFERTALESKREHIQFERP